MTTPDGLPEATTKPRPAGQTGTKREASTGSQPDKPGTVVEQSTTT